MRVHGLAGEGVGARAGQGEAGLAVAEFVERVEHFAFQALEVLQGHVQEVAGAAGRVEHAYAAQAVVEAAQFGGGFVGLALGGERQGGGLGVAPFGAQRFDHGGQHQPLDVGARGVVGAELVALARLQRAFEQGAEDGGFDVLPVGAGGLEQQPQLLPVERQGVGRLEQLAVEAQHVAGEHGGKAAGVHVAPELGEHAHGDVGLVGVAGEQVAEAVGREQADVFGEHGEQAAHQELGDAVGGVAGVFEAAGEFGELRGDRAGDARGLAAGIERERVEPDAAQAFADGRVAQVVERDAVAARVGEGRVGGARARELRVQLDAVADVHDDHERRAPFGRGQGAGVALGLAAGAQEGVVEALGLHVAAQLLGLQHEGAAAVQVDAAGAGAAVAVAEGDRALEHVVLFGRGVRGVHLKQRAQVEQEALRGRQLGSLHALPAGDERLDGVRAVVCHCVFPLA